MPPNPAPHIVQWLIELGISEANGMAAIPLRSVEIAAWQANTGIVLAPWVARLLKKLSTEYIAEMRRAEEKDCPAPFGAEVVQRATESADLRKLLSW